MLNVKLLQAMGGPGFKPSWVSVSADTRASDMPELENGARLPGELAAQRAQCRGLPVQCSTSRCQAPTACSTVCSAAISSRSEGPQRPSLVDRVESYIRGSLRRAPARSSAAPRRSACRCARCRRGSPGTAREFSELVEAQRETPRPRLSRPPASSTLDEIAERLGYGEQTSFGRAFKRWTGMTPQQFRATLSSQVGRSAT